MNWLMARERYPGNVTHWTASLLDPVSPMMPTSSDNRLNDFCAGELSDFKGPFGPNTSETSASTCML